MNLAPPAARLVCAEDGNDGALRDTEIVAAAGNECRGGTRGRPRFGPIWSTPQEKKGWPRSLCHPYKLLPRFLSEYFEEL